MIGVLDVLGEDLQPVGLSGQAEAIAAREGSATSATSRAEPAVSAATIGVRPSRRIA